MTLLQWGFIFSSLTLVPFPTLVERGKPKKPMEMKTNTIQSIKRFYDSSIKKYNEKENDFLS